MDDEKTPAAVPQPTGEQPAAEGQPGEQKEPPKFIPYERFAEVVKERNTLRDEKASGTWQQPTEQPQMPPSAPAYAPPAQVTDEAAFVAKYGYSRMEMVQDLGLINILTPAMDTVLTIHEETQRERNPYWSIIEQPYRNYLRQGFAPNVAVKLAKGERVNEIATKMAEDRAKASANVVGKFGEGAAPGMEGPNGLSQGQEYLADQLALDPEERKLAAAERAKRLQR